MLRREAKTGGPPRALISEWPSVRVDRIATPAGDLVEYRPATDLVSLATGPTRDVELVEADAPPRHLQVTAGQVHILPANVAVGIRLLGRAENIVVSLNPRLLTLASPIHGSSRVALRPAFGLRDRLLAELVRALWSETMSHHADPRYIQTLGAALAIHLTRKYSMQGPPRSASRRPVARPGLAPVLAYIEQKMDERLTLSTLASVARLSLFAFVRRFKGATGLPPHRYLIRRRVERAKVLLTDAALSIADVALRCGFGDQSAFTTAFRRVTQQTPRAFRDSFHRGNVPPESFLPQTAEFRPGGENGLHACPGSRDQELAARALLLCSPLKRTVPHGGRSAMTR